MLTKSNILHQYKEKQIQMASVHSTRCFYKESFKKSTRSGETHELL